jgi:hypothetical protein
MNNFMVSFIEHAVVYLVGSQLEQRIESLLKRQNEIDMAMLFSKKKTKVSTLVQIMKLCVIKLM